MNHTIKSDWYRTTQRAEQNKKFSEVIDFISTSMEDLSKLIARMNGKSLVLKNDVSLDSRLKEMRGGNKLEKDVGGALTVLGLDEEHTHVLGGTVITKQDIIEASRFLAGLVHSLKVVYSTSKITAPSRKKDTGGGSVSYYTFDKNFSNVIFHGGNSLESNQVNAALSRAGFGYKYEYYMDMNPDGIKERRLGWGSGAQPTFDNLRNLLKTKFNKKFMADVGPRGKAKLMKRNGESNTAAHIIDNAINKASYVKYKIYELHYSSSVTYIGKIISVPEKDTHIPGLMVVEYSAIKRKLTNEEMKALDEVAHGCLKKIKDKSAIASSLFKSFKVGFLRESNVSNHYMLFTFSPLLSNLFGEKETTKGIIPNKATLFPVADEEKEKILKKHIAQSLK